MTVCSKVRAMAYFKIIKCLFLTFILGNFPSASYAQTENTTRPEVTIPQGTVQGITLTTINNRTILGFLGLPYGEPPVGNLRFANPVMAGSWNGVRDGSIEGNMCPQAGNGEPEGDEDCLYLNLYTPELPSNETSLSFPVMMYIHGGAFIKGSGSFREFGPGYLLDKDVIHISINYRMGPFGFLTTADEVASGNYGLKDMVLALQWIQNNIAYFGGDPNRVTVYGQSAGGTAVHLLTLSDSTIGLFHRYITQSGAALVPWSYRPREAYSKLAYQLGESVNCSYSTSAALVDCLRTVSAADILNVYSIFAIWRWYPVDPWGPTDEPDIEGAFLLDSPKNLMKAGKVRDLPWMVGNCRDEGAGMVAQLTEDDDLYEDLMGNYDTVIPLMFFWIYNSDGGASWVEATKSFYFNNDLTQDRSVLIANFSKLFTDANNMYGAYGGLQYQLPVAQSPTYYYSFHYRGTYSNTMNAGDPTINYGIAHTDDTLYLFPSDYLFTKHNVSMNEDDYKMVDAMVELWTSFATNGVPTTSALNGVTWERYSSDDNILRIGNDSDIGLEIMTFPYKERMEFWDSLHASLESTSTSGTTPSTPNFIFVVAFVSLKFFTLG